VKLGFSIVNPRLPLMEGKKSLHPQRILDLRLQCRQTKPHKLTSTIATKELCDRGSRKARAVLLWSEYLCGFAAVHRLRRGLCGLQKCRRSPTLQSRIFWGHRRAEIITGLRRQMVRSSIKTLTELGDNGNPSTAHTEGGKKQNLKTEASFLHQVF
jgi:hypothetical protein